MTKPLFAVRLRAAVTSGLLAAITVAGIGLGTVPAQADPPPSATCNPEVDRVWDDIASAVVIPVITEFTSLNVAPGTTGQVQRQLSGRTA